MSDDPKRFDSVIEMLTHDCHKYALEIERLKAEVERLRKAGDEVCEMPYLCENDPAVVAWRAATEGKPSEQKSPSFIEDLGNGVEKHDLLFRYPAKETPPNA